MRTSYLQERILAPVEKILRGKGPFVQNKFTQVKDSEEGDRGVVVLENGVYIPYHIPMFAMSSTWDSLSRSRAQ